MTAPQMRVAPTAPWRERVAPVQRDKAAAAVAYDRMSGSYDAFVGRFEARYREAGLQALAVVLGERVLEIGFGTGHALVALAEGVGAGGHVVGLDLSPAMRALAEARVRRAGAKCRVELHVGDATRVPLADASVDAVFLSFTLELFDKEDIPLVLAEVRRVLVPGGRVGLVSLALPDLPMLSTRLYLLAHAAFPRLVDCRPIPARDILAEAGFQLVHAHTHRMWGLPVDCLVARR